MYLLQVDTERHTNRHTNVGQNKTDNTWIIRKKWLRNGARFDRYTVIGGGE